MTNQQLSRIIDLKDSDKRIQVIIGLIALVLAPFTWMVTLFFLGITHAVSTIYWMIRNDEPRTLSRKIIEPINIVVIIIFVGGLIIDNFFLNHSGDLSIALVIGLLCIGPVLGISYYMITLAEIRYYKELLANGNPAQS